MSKNKRVSIPESIRRQVLTEAGYRCGVPTCRSILAIDLHHLQPVSQEGGNYPSNLIALCPTCHALFHRGTITEDSLYVWKQILVSLSFAFDKEAIDLMMFLHKMKDDPRYLIKPDAVLQFAPLIGGDLVTLEWSEITVKNMMMIGYKVTLSAKGQHLIDAWMKGDRGLLNKPLVEVHNEV